MDQGILARGNTGIQSSSRAGTKAAREKKTQKKNPIHATLGTTGDPILTELFTWMNQAQRKAEQMQSMATEATQRLALEADFEILLTQIGIRASLLVKTIDTLEPNGD